jgi:hypothetical protein
MAWAECWAAAGLDGRPGKVQVSFSPLSYFFSVFLLFLFFVFVFLSNLNLI